MASELQKRLIREAKDPNTTKEQVIATANLIAERAAATGTVGGRISAAVLREVALGTDPSDLATAITQQFATALATVNSQTAEEVIIHARSMSKMLREKAERDLGVQIDRKPDVSAILARIFKPGHA